MVELRLEVHDFAGPTRWRWVLTGPGRKFLADHQVQLERNCWQFDAFTGLQEYLRWHVAPDRRIEQEAEIVASVGKWIGEHVFGPVGAAMVKQRPTTVRVVVPNEPPAAAQLMFVPLELGYAGGRPVGVQDVTLVMQHGADDTWARDRVPVGERLRVLGLFSLPTEGAPLNLRWERETLVRLFAEIGAVNRAVDVRVLQYGVTRHRLRDVLEEDEGWDVIHVSGHGAPGELELETEDGSADPVTAAQLAELLDLARERVKLVTLSACWSAALTLAEQRRLLQLPTLDGSAAPEEVGQWDGWTQRPAGALAAELADRLGCAVLAMRFPVVDDFAIALANKLYDLLAAKGQTLPRALAIALKDPKVIATPPTPGCPALSVTTPALFGGRAMDLRLKAPKRKGPDSYDLEALKLAEFPPQPDRFVGRTALMTRTSAALAPRSGVSGALLYGMPGGGKTACALELSYTHEHAFERLAWFKAPDEGLDVADALTRFALALETGLPGLQMVHLLADPGQLSAFLPKLTELFERRRVLIVLDNIESLLTDSGQWRDERWGWVVMALTAHSGLGRVLLTTRRVPERLDERVHAEAVDALSLDEALLLTRELPHLSKLMEGNLPGIQPDIARRLAVEALGVAQGHPKLLELADAHAANPKQLQKFLETADAAWQKVGHLPDGFFTSGVTHAASEDYLHVLAAWTHAISDQLPAAARDLFKFVCCLEESDRIRPVLNANWVSLWKRLGRPGKPLRIDAGLGALRAAGLVAVQPGTSKAARSYGIHPGVAAAGRDLAGIEFRTATDTELASYWAVIAGHALAQETKQQTGELVIRAGLSAAPYLLRLREWEMAAELLATVLSRDESTTAAVTMLPALQTIAAALSGSPTGPRVDATLTRAVQRIDRAAAERQMRERLVMAQDRHDYAMASDAAGALARDAMHDGRLGEGLALAEDSIKYGQQAGLGPWSQLGNEAGRLLILGEMGREEQVLAEVKRLRQHFNVLAKTSKPAEEGTHWNVWETLLDAGRRAALNLHRWSDALELSGAIVASKQGRGAPDIEIARTQVIDYGPLISIGCLDEAQALLIRCRQVFERAHDIRELGNVLIGLSTVEASRGADEVAISLAQDALRYKYLTEDGTAIQRIHHNLGTFLRNNARQPTAALAHHLASALIRTVTGVECSMNAAAADIREFGDAAVPPADVRELCRQVADVPGVHLDRLLAGLALEPQGIDKTLRELIRRARAEAAAPRPQSWLLAVWDPVIAGLVAAHNGDAKAAAAVEEQLTEYEADPQSAAVARALRRILNGESGQDGHGLTAELDEIGTVIVRRALGALAGEVRVPTELWSAMGMDAILGGIVGAVLAGPSPATAAAVRDALGSLEGPQAPVLADALLRVLGGERNLERLTAGLSDPGAVAVVTSVLHHIGTDQPN